MCEPQRTLFVSLSRRDTTTARKGDFVRSKTDFTCLSTDFTRSQTGFHRVCRKSADTTSATASQTSQNLPSSSPRTSTTPVRAAIPNLTALWRYVCFPPGKKR